MFDATIADVCHAIWNMNAWATIGPPFALFFVFTSLELWNSFKEEVLDKRGEQDD